MQPTDNRAERPKIQLLLTMDEAAEAMSLSRVFMYTLMRRGEFQTIKIGMARRVPLSELEAFIERQLQVS